jgi:hypothetical protein
VLHDAFAVWCPSIDAEGEMSSHRGHLRPSFTPFFFGSAEADFRDANAEQDEQGFCSWVRMDLISN